MLKIGLTGRSGEREIVRRGGAGKLRMPGGGGRQLGHQALEAGGEAHDAVIREFGAGIVGECGEIDRKAAGGSCFRQ